MNLHLQGKTAVVTGASRGVGRRIAVALAAHGAKVALVARGEQGLAETEHEIAGTGGIARCIAADLCDIAAAGELPPRVESALGRPAILVNAAGIFGPIQLIRDSDPERWIETIRINTLAPYLLCRAFVGGMIEAGWGRIVNVTSAAALHPPGPLNSAYGTSKVALNQFTRHLAAELAGTGVTANVFHPGDVKTDMWADICRQADAMGEAGIAYRQWASWVEETGGDPPEKAADLVLKIVGQEADAINGQFLWIEAGLQDPIPSWGEPQGNQPWK
jgi:NAD(P)-dependent dehydrogenase (short-subunit alcohol dehydrogenase family)